MFLMLKATMGVRVTEEEEVEGLDISEHGIETYPELRQGAGTGS